MPKPVAHAALDAALRLFASIFLVEDKRAQIDKRLLVARTRARSSLGRLDIH